MHRILPTLALGLLVAAAGRAAAAPQALPASCSS